MVLVCYSPMAYGIMWQYHGMMYVMIVRCCITLYDGMVRYGMVGPWEATFLRSWQMVLLALQPTLLAAKVLPLINCTTAFTFYTRVNVKNCCNGLCITVAGECMPYCTVWASKRQQVTVKDPNNGQ